MTDLSSTTPRVIVVEGTPRVEAVTVSTIDGPVEVDTSSFAGVPVVRIDGVACSLSLTRSGAYDLALAILGRLGLIGFPGAEVGS